MNSVPTALDEEAESDHRDDDLHLGFVVFGTELDSASRRRVRKKERVQVSDCLRGLVGSGLVRQLELSERSSDPGHRCPPLARQIFFHRVSSMGDWNVFAISAVREAVGGRL